MKDPNNENQKAEGDKTAAGPDMPASPEKYEHLLRAIGSEDAEETTSPVTADETGSGEGEPAEPTTAAATVLETPRAESKTRRFLRKAIRWTVGILIVFGLGLITGIYVFYRPAAQEAERKSQGLTTELETANTNIGDLEGQVSDLQAQISSLQPLKDKNDQLLSEIADLNLHFAIVDARLDVTRAVLALGEDDRAQARIILDKTAKTLVIINDLLDPDQQEVVTAMKQRLTLVMNEVDEDPFAAQSDLDVLGTKLLQLEDALYTE
jgi:hypothetical protein